MLHSTYKKAINKALQSKSRSSRLIKMLDDFVKECDQIDDQLDDQSDNQLDDQSDNQSDEQSDNHSDDFNSNDHLDESVSNEEFQLKNPKKRKGKGRPPGTKRIKSSHEKQHYSTTKQKRSCKKCGGIGHYQKKCTIDT